MGLVRLELVVHVVDDHVRPCPCQHRSIRSRHLRLDHRRSRLRPTLPVLLFRSPGTGAEWPPGSGPRSPGGERARSGKPLNRTG